MNLSNKFFTNVGIDPKIAEDLSFTVLDTNSNETLFQKDRIPMHRSVGNITSILGMHKLMSMSLAIVSPNLVFSADYPNYILHSDDPSYMKTIPMITPELYRNMPHYRWDLYDRDFTKYDSLDKIPAPHVTWGVVRTEPGTMGGPPFRGTQELKPRQREAVIVFTKEHKNELYAHSDKDFIEDDQYLYKFIKINGQVFDNLVQYNTWARSAWEAEELIEWFHKDYLLKYTGMFREAGINNMVFQRRVRDDTLSTVKTDYHLRSMLYYIRTEYISTETVLPIRKMDVDMATIGKTIGQSSNGNSNFIDTLLNNWHFK